MTRQDIAVQPEKQAKRSMRVSGGDLLPQIQRLVVPDKAATIPLGGSATLNVQVWLGQFPLRPTAAWVAITAALAAGIFTGSPALDWRACALLLLLVDPLWGMVWRLAAGRGELLPLHEGVVKRNFWLPYIQPGSPAARLMEGHTAELLPVLFRVALPAIVTTVAVAAVLNFTALWMTGVVIAATVVGWIGRLAYKLTPLLLHSLVVVALPWGLTLTFFEITPQHTSWPMYGALIVAWTLHNWGENRCLCFGQEWLGLLLLAAGDLGLGLLLFVARAPIWLAILSLFWLLTWLTVLYRQPLTRLRLWWLLAMLISGVAFGQTL